MSAPEQWQPARLVVAGRVLVRLRWGCVCELCAWRGPWRTWFALLGADADCRALGIRIEDDFYKVQCAAFRWSGVWWI